MKKIFFFKAAFILLICINALIAKAQNVNLIDIDKYTNSYPQNVKYSAKNTFAYFNGYSYFSADDGIHGRELWKTDGTANGTQLVKDINPGTLSSDAGYPAFDIVKSGDKLFFAADGGPNGFGLWVSDGTMAGTQFVADISNGTYSLPTYLTDVNGTLYFAVSYFDYINTFNYVNQIWKSDGTAAGTTLVTDLGANGYSLQQLTNVDGKLFFTFYNYNVYPYYQLYSSDGTSDGTSPIAAYYSLPLQLTASNGLLYFIADDGNGSKLFSSDGTTAGTTAINNNGINCYATSDSYNRDTFAIINNVLYFQGSDAAGDNTLYKYDENNAAADVTLVKDIIPGVSSYPSYMTNVNGTLFFTIGPAGGDAELWKSDGTDAGTVLVKDVNPGGLNGYYGLTNANGKLLFVLGTNTTGYELWKSDGTATGTKIVRNINSGVYSSYPGYLTYANGIVLFQAFDAANGNELWKSDGTTIGTRLVKDINKTTTSSSYPNGFIEANNGKVLFNASDEEHGTELWSTDGTSAGTALVKDIFYGTYGSYPSYFTKLKNSIYFFADDSTGYHLWKTNGNANSLQKIITPLDTGPDVRYIYNVIAANDVFYLFIYNYTSFQYELWRSDGTSGGTYAIESDFGYIDFYNTAVIGNSLYFIIYNYNTGAYELLKSDGTSATTNSLYSSFSTIFSLTNFNSKLYFSAIDSFSYNYVLWVSDGTQTSTKVLKPLVVSNSYPSSFAQANGKLFFYGEDLISKGFELYATDGTSNGTKLVKDIYKGENSSGVNLLIGADTLVYFSADDGRHGYELWKSNGTKEGTSIVKNISPGAGSTLFTTPMLTAGNELYFVINDTLWQTDGTKKGTKPIDDPALNGVSSINLQTVINGDVYFSGYNYATGDELYIVKGNSFAPAVEMVSNSITTKLNTDEFAARLVTNPVIGDMKIAIDVKQSQQANISITNLLGRTLVTENRNLSAGKSVLSYNTSSWAKGIYLVTITTSQKLNATLKAMK